MVLLEQLFSQQNISFNQMDPNKNHQNSRVLRRVYINTYIPIYIIYISIYV